MARTITKTTTLVTPPDLDFEIELLHNTTEVESDMLFHVTDKEILIAYLVRDDDCPDPMENEGEGEIFTSNRHAGKEVHQRFQEACGLDSGWQPDFSLLDEAEVVKAAHAFLREDSEAFATALKHCDLCWPREEKEDNDMNYVFRCLNTLNELTPVVDVFSIQVKLWVEAVKKGTIGDKYHVMLDVYDHSGTSYSISGEGTQCRFDTSRGGAVWVPDACAIENFEDKNLTLEENRAKAREYARGCVEEYNAWLAGDTWGVVIQKYDRVVEESEKVETCLGMIGHEHAMEELKFMFEGAKIE